MSSLSIWLGVDSHWIDKKMSLSWVTTYTFIDFSWKQILIIQRGHYLMEANNETIPMIMKEKWIQACNMKVIIWVTALIYYEHCLRNVRKHAMFAYATPTHYQVTLMNDLHEYYLLMQKQNKSSWVIKYHWKLWSEVLHFWYVTLRWNLARIVLICCSSV